MPGEAPPREDKPKVEEADFGKPQPEDAEVPSRGEGPGKHRVEKLDLKDENTIRDVSDTDLAEMRDAAIQEVDSLKKQITDKRKLIDAAEAAGDENTISQAGLDIANFQKTIEKDQKLIKVILREIGRRFWEKEDKARAELDKHTLEELKTMRQETEAKLNEAKSKSQEATDKSNKAAFTRENTKDPTERASAIAIIEEQRPKIKEANDEWNELLKQRQRIDAAIDRKKNVEE